MVAAHERARLAADVRAHYLVAATERETRQATGTAEETWMTIRDLAFVLTILVSVCGIAAADIAEEDIVGYWPLDEGGGDEAGDVSGNDHHGAITDGDWVAGQFGGGLEFNGTSTFIEVMHHEDFNLGANFTLAAWAMTNGLPDQHIGLPRKEAEYVLHPTAGGAAFNLRVYIGQGGAWAASTISAAAVDFGDWAHIAGTYDGETLTSWVDGEVSGEGAVPGEATPTTNNLRWANDCCGGRMYDGILDELVIFNRALTEDEMQAVMNDGVEGALSVEARGKLATRWGTLKR